METEVGSEGMEREKEEEREREETIHGANATLQSRAHPVTLLVFMETGKDANQACSLLRPHGLAGPLS